MASKPVSDAVVARLATELAQFTAIPLSDYSVAPRPPNDVDEFICARFIGTYRERAEIGGDPPEDCAVFEDGTFRIDVYVRINPKSASGQTLETRMQTVRETVIAAFINHAFDGVEIFSASTGLDLPAGAPPGWWADSIGFGFHFEH